MAYRTLEIALQHAEDLASARLVGRMAVYAVVSVSDELNVSNRMVRSPVDHDGHTRPVWNFPMRFTVDDSALRMERLTLRFRLACQLLLTDRDVGSVEVSINELFASRANADANGWRHASRPVTRPGGIPQGRLSFSYRFSAVVNPAHRAEPPRHEDRTYASRETDWSAIWVVLATGVMSIFEILVRAAVADPPASQRKNDHEKAKKKKKKTTREADD